MRRGSGWSEYNEWHKWMELKYLIMDNLSPIKGTETPVIFPAIIEHKHIAQGLGGHIHVAGAGFVSLWVNEINVINAMCYGSSFSLGIKSRGQVDSDIIEDYLV